MKLILIFSVLLLTGCGRISRITAAYTGYSIECVKGVEYIQFTSGATPSYNIDGSLRACKE